MPAGKPWLQRPPRFSTLPKGERGHVVYASDYGPPKQAAFTGNPDSTARMALVGSHAMFYVAQTPATALWEVVLRHVEPDQDGQVWINLASYRDKRIVEVELTQDLPLLILARPELLQLFPNGDSDEVAAVESLLKERDHRLTHPEARQLFDELHKAGHAMPALMWPSRQDNLKKVYLSYSTIGTTAPWLPVADSIALDSLAGRAIIQQACQAAGFTWTPVATTGGTAPKR